jgi:hypothetical protein
VSSLESVMMKYLAEELEDWNTDADTHCK